MVDHPSDHVPLVSEAEARRVIVSVGIVPPGLETLRDPNLLLLLSPNLVLLLAGDLRPGHDFHIPLGRARSPEPRCRKRLLRRESEGHRARLGLGPAQFPENALDRLAPG